MATTASSAECSRPRKRSAAASSACTPSETRFTPAWARAANLPASTEVGLALERYFDVGRGIPQGARALDARHPLLSGDINEGVPPPKKIVSTRRSGASRAACSRLGEQRLPPARLLDAVAHMTVEIAVGTLRFAERPMHIDAERRGAHRKHAATSSAKARPRWLIAFFSVSDISAQVRVWPAGWKHGS